MPAPLSDNGSSPILRAPVRVSVVLPCLDEVGGVVTAVEEALQGLRSAGLSGQVIVVDNGSTDGSAAAAAAVGATVVSEPQRGYGMAIRRGLQAARGDVIVLADADSSYDLRQLGELVASSRCRERTSSWEQVVRRCRGRSDALAPSTRRNSGSQSSACYGDWALVSRQPVWISRLQTRAVDLPRVHGRRDGVRVGNAADGAPCGAAHRRGPRAVSTPDGSQQAAPGRRRSASLPLAASSGCR